MTTPELFKALMATAAVYGREFTKEAAELIVSDLADYPSHAVVQSLTRCRKELRTFPTVADIIARIDDGRPGPEEAWAMIPKDEYTTVVWTAEMRDAWASARPLLDSDPVAARMAFRESYSKLLADSRASGRQPKWEVSLGNDPHQRSRALLEAVEKKRLPEAYVQDLLPHSSPKPNLQLVGPAEPELTPVDPVAMISEIRKQIQRSAQ